MGLLDKLFGRPKTAPTAKPEHAVIAHLVLSDSQFGTSDERDAIHALSDELAQAIAAGGTGEFDGDEFGEGRCTLYMYGSDADRLFNSVEAILRASPLCRGARVIKRFGPAGGDGVKSVEVRL